MPTALMLLEYLTSRAKSCRISAGDGAGRELDPHAALRPGGLTSRECLLPSDSRTFWGYSLLREYFVFPEKFLFVDLYGFDQLPAAEDAPSSLSLAVSFDRDLPPEKPFRTDNFRLYCTPAANIFKRDAEPVVCTGLRREYRVVADSSYPQSCRVHSITSVTGVNRLTGERTSYEPFHTFKNIGRADRRTFTAHFRTGPDGLRQCAIALGGKQLTEGAIREENLAVEAWCTNAMLPREEIREGGINRPGAGFPDYVMVANITRPTLPLAPPPDIEYLWMFLSQLGANYTTLASADTLKAVLRLYNWSGEEGKTRRVDAISSVEAAPVEIVVRGCVVRGVEFRVSLVESEYRDSADLQLFGEVLKVFLAHYVSINSYVDLVLILQPSGAMRRLSSIKGKQWPL
jgi:type VI secretion system protein ImpG